MNKCFCLVIFFTFIYAVYDGNMRNYSLSFMLEAQHAAEVCFSLMGSFCFWGGIMKIAENAKIVDILAKAFFPLFKRIFTGIASNGKAMKAILMNLTANLLGMGNAATPFGIKAVEELKKEEKSGNVATNNMVLLVVMNTASLGLIPTTVIMMRIKTGSAFPEEIITAVWIASLISVIGAVTMAKVISCLIGKKNG